MQSKDADKKILGIMVKPNNGKFDHELSIPSRKLRMECDDTAISHRFVHARLSIIFQMHDMRYSSISQSTILFL